MAVDDMPAGREMDALVATKVMGLPLGPCSGRLTGAANGSCWVCTVCAWCDRGPMPHTTIPRPYSTDMAAAWEVVEKLREIVVARGMWGPNLHIYVPVSASAHWFVECWNDTHGGMAEPHSHYTQFSGLADTAPLAICRAALKAVGVP